MGGGRGDEIRDAENACSDTTRWVIVPCRLLLHTVVRRSNGVWLGPEYSEKSVLLYRKDCNDEFGRSIMQTHEQRIQETTWCMACCFESSDIWFASGGAKLSVNNMPKSEISSNIAIHEVLYYV